MTEENSKEEDVEKVEQEESQDCYLSPWEKGVVESHSPENIKKMYETGKLSLCAFRYAKKYFEKKGDIIE
jgi:hypothetical protein